MHKRMSWKQLKWLIPFLLIGLILYQSGQELRQFSLAAAFRTLESLTGLEQFSPTWDARYLAIRKRRKLLPSLLRTARLISRKK
ncbi:hypothetical protein [Exiguobacterium alkaliphilum]|uniref:Uncharacterized protein n=1 Tax=Exiguobacterium alkaliphilum TaxID=1428684 RepID=A0ABT2KX60_9BACL|nr:hypothetical protein [Exiguobacterium alkaliphilum]MCT4795036.1 hypothetical protein [Exiguobacterium alkaliphilum]